VIPASSILIIIAFSLHCNFTALSECSSYFVLDVTLQYVIVLVPWASRSTCFCPALALLFHSQHFPQHLDTRHHLVITSMVSATRPHVLSLSLCIFFLLICLCKCDSVQSYSDCIKRYSTVLLRIFTYFNA